MNKQMNQVKKKKFKKSESGQAAIFVALIFPILFVLFAMSINVGLIVHDKINLQNAVDLAAYYGAQKQAEVLNAMAHNNYLIRQSWKLLSWRYWVLGTAGYNTREHPASPASPPGLSSRDDINPLLRRYYRENADRPLPGVCVNYRPMWPAEPGHESDNDGNDSTSPCKIGTLERAFSGTPQFNITLPTASVLAGTAISRILQSANQIMQNRWRDLGVCYGLRNFMTAGAFMVGTVMDQANRKQVIRSLAQNLSEPANKVLDLDGQTIAEGVRKTLVNNLTFQNGPEQGGLQEIKFYNSMTGETQLGPVDSTSIKWFPEIQVSPIMTYVDVTTGSGASSIRYQPYPGKIIGTAAGSGPYYGPPINIDKAADCGYNIDVMDLYENTFSKIGALGGSKDSIYRWAVGLEKNPWYLFYVGVEATTVSRQLFHPFGEGVELKARAFAKPFGGRMGPWYGKVWNSGNPTSTATNRSQQVDQRLPFRLSPTGSGFDSSGANQFYNRVPNYSRYPGDPHGMTSSMALGSVKLPSTFRRPPRESAFHYEDYVHLLKTINRGDDQVLSPLPANKNDPTIPPPHPRKIGYAMAAITPDLFDLQYYTVLPNYENTYLQRMRKGLLNNVPFAVRPGLSGENHYQTIERYGKKNSTTNGAPGQVNPLATYSVADWQHLLNSWVTEDWPAHHTGEFPQNYFGKCLNEDTKRMPSNCRSGGRVGYSVKIVSKQAVDGEITLPDGARGEVQNRYNESKWEVISGP